MRYVMLAAALAVALTLGPRVATGEAAERRVWTCNIDGTYTCYDSCWREPYYGRFCCEMHQF